LELENNNASPEDEGTIWFSDSGAEEKVIDYLEDLADEGILFKLSEANGEGKNEWVQPTSFLDLGTGNGHLLFALRAAEWRGQMLGVDYSAASIKLARQIEWRRVQERPDSEAVESSTPISFEEHDILSRTLPSQMLRGGFDVVLDKGTFDAISLSSERDVAGRRVCETYCSSVERLVRDGGLFIITSCNWTETELLAWFGSRDASEVGAFKLKDRIKYPKFTFGGQTGQSVVTLCFEKKHRSGPRSEGLNMQS